MSGAGRYSHKFTWLRATETKESVYGQDKRTYSNVGELWAWVEESSAVEQDEYGAVMSRADVKIHVRQYPAVRTIDRLQSKSWGDTYEVTGINRGDNELILSAHRLNNVP